MFRPAPVTGLRPLQNPRPRPILMTTGAMAFGVLPLLFMWHLASRSSPCLASTPLVWQRGN